MALLTAVSVILIGCGGGAKLPGQSGGGLDVPSGRPEYGVRRYSEAELRNLLLPRGAVPVGLTQAAEYVTPNEFVASFFDDSEAAMRSMAESGRVQGAAVDYRVPGTPRATAKAVAVSSSVSYYKTVAGAQAVITDPTMELVIHRFGLQTAEISLEKVGHESRAFRGFRDGDSPDLAAYLILFRRDNVIGAVMVVVPAATDDGGKLAMELARRQAGDLTLPRRGAAAAGTATPSPTPATTVQR